MKWLILAIFAEVSVLLCLIFAFDGALHSLSSARLTWDHFAVSALYAGGPRAFLVAAIGASGRAGTLGTLRPAA